MSNRNMTMCVADSPSPAFELAVCELLRSGSHVRAAGVHYCLHLIFHLIVL